MARYDTWRRCWRKESSQKVAFGRADAREAADTNTGAGDASRPPTREPMLAIGRRCGIGSASSVRTRAVWPDSRAAGPRAA